MSDDKKPKIDLKSRLGKKTVAVQGGPAVPPPVGIPKPTGIPMPPFGQPEKKGPVIDASDPYAAIPAQEAPARVEPQAIKIEMSEEVVQAQKKTQTRTLVFALVAGLVGVGVGFGVGDRSAANKANAAALEGARQLKGEVEKAKEVTTEMSETIGAALKKIKESKYPEEEVRKLGELNIPFEGGTLAGKGLGRFNQRLATGLVMYATAVAEANDQKDKIHSLLSTAKKPILDFLEQQQKPKVRWAVYVEGGPHGPWASLQLLPEPFLAKSDEKVKDKDGKEQPYKWPAEFKIPQGGRTFDLKRYESGEPGGNPPKIIPVNPGTEGAVCPSDTITRLARELAAMQEVLKGDQTQGREKDGLITLGERVLEELGKVGAP